MNAAIRAGRQRCRGERGGSLIFMLAFLSFLGVLAAAMLSVTYASFKNTQTTRHSSNRLYGADGGVDYGIQVLRDDTSYCANSSAGTQSLPNQTINDKTVTVTCETLGGTTGGGNGGGGTPSGPTSWPLILTGYNGNTSNETFKTSGSTGRKEVVSFTGGPVFNAGGFSWSGGSDSYVFEEIHQYNPYCTNNKSNPKPGKPGVTGTWTCENSATYPVPDPNPTLANVPTAAAPTPVTVGSCVIYFPGKYTSANKPSLSGSGNYYFASGVYYFEGVGSLTLTGKLFGGEPAPGDTKKMTNTPCSNDASANALRPGTATGYGVKFIAGGNTAFSLANSSSTDVELFARWAPTAGSEGTDGISMFAPKTAGTGYLASTAGSVLSSGGTGSDLVIHGLTYIPNSNSKIWGTPNKTAGNAPIFGGGLVIGALELAVNSSMTTYSYASIPSGSGTPPSDRTILVTATSTAPGEAPVTETAVIVVSVTPGTPPSIESWRRN